MIIVDGKKEMLSDSFIEQLKKEIGDGRYLQSPKNLLTKLQTRKEGKDIIVGPSRANILLVDTFYGRILRDEKDGKIVGIDFNKDHAQSKTHKVRYCENAETRLDGTFEKFFPEYYTVGGTGKPATKILQQEDYEVFFFMDYITRKVSTSKNAKENTQKDFVLEITNPAMDATKKRTESRFKRKAEFMVMEEGSEGGFTTEQLENIGRHLQLQIKSYRNLDQLREAILMTAGNDEISKQLSGEPKVFGYEYILLLGDKKGPDYDLRQMCAEAIQSGLVEHDGARKQWVYKKDGHVVGSICAVDDSAPVKINALISFLKLDIEAREKLESLLGYKKETTFEDGTPKVIKVKAEKEGAK